MARGRRGEWAEEGRLGWRGGSGARAQPAGGQGTSSAGGWPLSCQGWWPGCGWQMPLSWWLAPKPWGQQTGQPGPTLPSPRYPVDAWGQRSAGDRRRRAMKGVSAGGDVPRGSTALGFSRFMAQSQASSFCSLNPTVKFKEHKTPGVSVGLESWVSSPFPPLLPIIYYLGYQTLVALGLFHSIFSFWVVFFFFQFLLY